MGFRSFFHYSHSIVAGGSLVMSQTTRGIPVGESTVKLTNVYGVTSEAQMYVIVAGYFLDSFRHFALTSST
ncbi:hypothetical protein LQV63_07395 [Paenibacillus profundus]|uniref:Uncharacterized protein n=1 Tax=Paenibacillus profundus TaxID=1173085 RepID=A0ABS8YAY3_9BACL|nr:hypothetical protein [Paenibacillus profundus]